MQHTHKSCRSWTIVKHYLNAPICELHHLQMLINVAARLVSGHFRFDHITDFVKMFCTGCKSHKGYTLCTLIYMAIYELAPTYLSDLLVKSMDIMTFGHRHIRNYQPPQLMGFFVEFRDLLAGSLICGDMNCSSKTGVIVHLIQQIIDDYDMTCAGISTSTLTSNGIHSISSSPHLWNPGFRASESWISASQTIQEAWHGRISFEDFCIWCLQRWQYKRQWLH